MRFAVKSHQPADREKLGFLLENFWFALSLFGKGDFSHRPGEKPEFFMHLKNLSKKPRFEVIVPWLFKACEKKPPNRPTALKRPRPKQRQTRGWGSLPWSFESFADIFFSYISESPSCSILWFLLVKFVPFYFCIF